MCQNIVLEKTLISIIYKYTSIIYCICTNTKIPTHSYELFACSFESLKMAWNINEDTTKRERKLLETFDSVKENTNELI